MEFELRTDLTDAVTLSAAGSRWESGDGSGDRNRAGDSQSGGGHIAFLCKVRSGTEMPEWAGFRGSVRHRGLRLFHQSDLPESRSVGARQPGYASATDDHPDTDRHATGVRRNPNGARGHRGRLQ